MTARERVSAASESLAKNLSTRALRAGLSESAPAARSDHSLGAIHGQTRQHGHACPVSEISHGEKLCGRAAPRVGKRDQIHGLLSQQSEKHSRRESEKHCGACAKSSRNTAEKCPIQWRNYAPCRASADKTANVVLGNAFHIDEGIVVDTHVIRLSQRLGLTKQKDPVKIELDLMKLVPRAHWTDWSHWLIWHGRRRCYARKPDCSRCEVFKLCPSGKIFLRTGKALKPPEIA